MLMNKVISHSFDICLGVPGHDLSPVGVVVQVQCTCAQEVSKLLAVAKVERQVGGDDGFADDLQHLLVLAGSQVGENIVPFQLWETKRSIKKQKLHLGGIRLGWAASAKPPKKKGPKIEQVRMRVYKSKFG